VSDVLTTRKLWTYEFIALLLVIAATLGNVCVFYSFYHYLGEIGIPVAWRGFLVGLEPMASFVLRLFVIFWLHVRNAYNVAMISLLLLTAASCSYLWVTSIPALIVLRIFHGASFVLMSSAAVALIVNFIPGEKSGQGFSAISIATMLPFAVVPPLAELTLPYVRNEADIYAAIAVFSVLAMILLISVRGRIAAAVSGLDKVLMRRPTQAEIRANLRLRPVVVLITALLLIYLSQATLFYFVKDLSLENRTGDVGLFFTIAMAMMIMVRAGGGALFDRRDKVPVLQKAVVVLIPTLIILADNTSPGGFYLLAALYGLSIGVIMPLLNALLFMASPPPLRGLNTNLAMFCMDVAYFVVPYLGGVIIACGAGFGSLFYLCAGYTAISLILVTNLLPRGSRE
jgi:MFS family permease